MSIVELASTRPAVIDHWAREVRDRLFGAAILGVTIFVLGEVRSGRLIAGWGEANIAKAEKALGAYLVVPVDFDVLDAYVDLRARYFKQLGDNDLWIAATAKARGWPLVTTDTDFCRLKDEIELIYLPAKPDSPQSCP